MKLRPFLLTLSTALFAAGCASVSSPEGGPKDETPPTLLSSSPKDQQLNVNTNTLTLVFDEEVMENKLTSELLITPNTNNKYKIRRNKNEFTLEFEKPFQENTTYTFNFREGLTDITEKNKVPNLKLAFSTGSYIDSSSVSGKAIDLLTQKPLKEVVVSLYPTNDTLSIRKNKPYYQTETDAEGNFEINNVKEGEYRIYGLEDKNNNSYYDNENERIAYVTSPINITANTDSVNLQLVKLDTKKPIMMRRENYTDRFVANYNEGIKNFAAKAVGTTAATEINTKILADGKAAELFINQNYNGGKTILTAVDSAGNIAADTIDIKFEGKRSQRIQGAAIKVINNAAPQNYAPGSAITLELETPVTIVGKEPILILSDSVVIQKLAYPQQVTLDPTQTELTFKLPTLKKKTNTISLLVDSTAVKPVTGTSIHFSPQQINIAEDGGVGSVKGNINTKYTSYIIQLLTPDYKVVDEIKNLKNYEFKNIAPGSYLIRVLIDENNNNVWDSGDPTFEKSPEKVYLYTKPLDVRANWELEGINLEF